MKSKQERDHIWMYFMCKKRISDISSSIPLKGVPTCIATWGEFCGNIKYTDPKSYPPKIKSINSNFMWS